MTCYVRGCENPVDTTRSGTFCEECLDELWAKAVEQHQARRFRARLLNESSIEMYDYQGLIQEKP